MVKVLMVLPVRTAPDIVKKLIQAIYTGKLDISTDIQHILTVADALLVRSV